MTVDLKAYTIHAMTTLDPRIKSALVTGAARRTGQAMALWLAERGVRVAIHYRGSETEA